MTRDELSEGWERLRGIYSSMPSFSPEIAREWLRVLEPFSRADLDAAISDYISHERYKPLPVDLARLCRKAQRVRREKEFELEFQANGTCPYCGGLGNASTPLIGRKEKRYYLRLWLTRPGYSIRRSTVSAAGVVGSEAYPRITRRSPWPNRLSSGRMRQT